MSNFLNKNKKYLYLITPPNILTKQLSLKKFLIILERVLKTKKVKFLQLRLKNKKKNKILNCLKKINLLCKKYNTLCFINDYADNHILNFCDGVHLGQNDLSENKIKIILKKKKFLGISCQNSNKLAKKATLYNPNYISFGSFFSSKTKKRKYRANIKNICWFKKNFDVPCAAIGGINLVNCKKILETNCNLLAVCSGVWKFKEGPEKAVKEFYKIIKKYENIS